MDDPAVMTESLGLETAPAGDRASTLVEAGTRGRRWPRVLGRIVGEEPGPTLVCVAGLHGNEPAGLHGLEHVLGRLRGEGARIRGQFVALAGNLEALASSRRFLAEDLNRMWLAPRIRAVRSGTPTSVEEAELRELDRELRQVVAEARGDVFAVDLHTISGPGPAFVVLDDTLLNRRFGLRFPVPMIFGLEEELSGTLSHYLTAEGVIPVGFEAGQHEDPASERRAAAGIWIALEVAGLLEAGRRPEPEAARRLLAEESQALPKVVEVRHRHAIAEGDGFEMRPNLASFQPVTRGCGLARDRRGTVWAAESGLLLMPLYQEQGEDGFFLVRPVWPIWLKVSEWLRPLRLERFLHWLPGVSRHPEHEGAFVVDRWVARFEALQIFHLLGFRRRGAAERFLIIARRRQGNG